ncbi:MAG: leucine-rich repeat domain-containing protein [Lachnospiraceae bacterium]|nr:leucine-rich repeat domain-containing protein [Lachnospiraceae bacterium]
MRNKKLLSLKTAGISRRGLNLKSSATALAGRTLALALACVMPFTTCPVTVSASGENTRTGDRYIYGTVNLPYADYYYGELNQVPESAVMDLTVKDKAASLREYGMYDSVSSATTSKYKNFGATYYSENEDSDTGGIIEGIKEVYIAVPENLYNEAREAVSSKAECSNRLLEIIENMTVTETIPSEYKVLNGDGTLTAMKDSQEAVNVGDAQISVANSTTWGQYQISVVSDELPERDDMEAVIIETTDGTKYGMKHLENLWFKTGEIAFAVTDDFKVPQGNTLTSKRYMDLQGKTISKITYIVRGGADVVFNTNLFCKTLLDKDGGYNYSGENTIYKDGAEIVMNGVTPKDSSYILSKVEFGGNVLKEDVDYTYQNNVLIVKNTENTGIGTYTLTYSDSKYEDIKTTVQYTSSMTADEIKITDNFIQISNKEVTLEDYLAAVDSIKINGSGLRGNNLGTTVFNPDGSVNFDAEISFHGSKTKVFPEAGKEYTIEVTSSGYPSVSGVIKYSTELLPINDMKVSLSKKTYYYDGKFKTPEVTVENLVEGTDYAVSYKNNKNIGKASVIVEGIGKYTGSVTMTFAITVKKGASYKSGSLKYSITKASATGTGTVAVSAPLSKSISNVSIPSAVKIGGVSFKVTSLGGNAFKSCKKLKTVTIGSNVTAIGSSAFYGDSALKKITIKSTKISKVGNNAFKGINKNAVIKVPSSKLKAYTKLLKGKGQGSKVKITK